MYIPDRAGETVSGWYSHHAPVPTADNQYSGQLLPTNRRNDTFCQACTNLLINS